MMTQSFSSSTTITRIIATGISSLVIINNSAHPSHALKEVKPLDPQQYNDDFLTLPLRYAPPSSQRILQEEGDTSLAPDDHYLRAGAGWGTHFVDIWIGNPAQKRTLAVLTKSDFTAFPCMDCIDCGNTIHNKFDQLSSTTFDIVSCGECISQVTDENASNDEDDDQGKIDTCDMKGELCIASDRFLDHSSWTAYEVRDSAFVGGAAALGDDIDEDSLAGSDVAVEYGFPLVFGCQTLARGWFANNVVDGILGFSSASSSFINQMYDNQMLRQRKFALCFAHLHEEEEGHMDEIGANGVVTLGGYDPRLDQTPMSYAQSVGTRGDTGYNVFINGIYIREGGGESVVPNSMSQKLHAVRFNAEEYNSQQSDQNGDGIFTEGATVDSGTPYLLFDKTIEAAFQNAWRKAMGGTPFSYGKLYLTKQQVAKMPTILLQLQSSDTVDQSMNPKSVSNMAGDLDQSSPYDVLVAVPATHYLQYYKHGNFYRSLISLQNEGTILGASVMQGHNVLYDLEFDRIGFAEAPTCKILRSSFEADDDLFDEVQMTDPNQVASEEETESYVDGESSDPAEKVPLESVGTAKRSRISGVQYCTTATCQSYTVVGYAFVATALFIAYNLSRPVDRSGFMDMFEYGDEDEIDFDAEEHTIL